MKDERWCQKYGNGADEHMRKVERQRSISAKVGLETTGVQLAGVLRLKRKI